MIQSSITLRLSIWEIQQTTRAAGQKREGECASINTMVHVGEREMQSRGTRATKPTNFTNVVGVDEEAARATLCTHVFLADTLAVKSFSQKFSNISSIRCKRI